MRSYVGTCKGICSYNLVYNFLSLTSLLLDIPFAITKFSFCGALFSNVFWHVNEAFPKARYKNEIVSLLVIFYLPYSKYSGVKICVHSCCYQNQHFSFMSQSCRSCRTRVMLALFVSHSYCTRAAFVSLVSGTRVVN